MLELGAGPIIFRAIGWLYWAIAIGAVIVALSWPKRRVIKASLAALAVVAFLAPVVSRELELRQERAVRAARMNAAIEQFEARCRNAGERISQTAVKVEGIVWMKWRPRSPNYGDQFELDDPYGRDCGSEECIKNLLRVTRGIERDPQGSRQYSRGYRFVETIDPKQKSWYRYELVVKVIAKRTAEQMIEFKKNAGFTPEVEVYGVALERTPIDARTSRYGVNWEDISTPEDRERWIAGGVLRVIDLDSGHVIAERIGYLLDTGQGNRDGARSPWTWASAYGKACPAIEQGANEAFLERVLQPSSQGETK